jgi:hypothetical protein
MIEVKREGTHFHCKVASSLVGGLCLHRTPATAGARVVVAPALGAGFTSGWPRNVTLRNGSLLVK